MIRHRATIGVGLALVFGAACQRSETEGLAIRQFSGPTMGTTYSVKIVSSDLSRDDVAMLREQVERTLEDVNSKMSHYLEDSEITRFNNWNSIEPFEASTETFSVLSQAKQISAATNGAFDITVAPLVNAWGFGPAGRPTETPAAAEIDSLRLKTGWDQIDLDEATTQVTKTHRDLIADLSAIAKGHGVDRVVETLEAAGLTNFMVEIGGEVGARGVNQKHLPWRIGIERPVPGERAVELVVPLVDTSLATSGDYRNYYELDNKRISHTIDPRTGYPITHNIASVSVVHSSCAHADAYATGLLVLGSEGLDLAEDLGLAAYFLIREDNDIFVGRMTSAFKRLLKE